MEYEVAYKVGGWPSPTYEGTIKVWLNYTEEEEILAKARREIERWSSGLGFQKLELNK